MIENDIGIRIKYLADIPHIEQVEGGDWIDLRSAEDLDLKAFEYYPIRLGLAMELPDGYEAHIVPRSSTYKNWGIISAESMGVIDNKYKGDNDEWHFLAIALRDTHISKGDRICQFRIVRNQEKIKWHTVEKLGNCDRGGIGSTGKS